MPLLILIKQNNLSHFPEGWSKCEHPTKKSAFEHWTYLIEQKNRAIMLTSEGLLLREVNPVQGEKVLNRLKFEI